MARRNAGKKINILGFESEETGVYLMAALILSVAIYALTKLVILGMISLILLAILFFRDAMPKKWDSGSIKSSVYELLVAFAAALAVWYGLTFILQTPTPIDVVTSCSMLHALDRGDLIFLQGGEIRAREVELEKPIEIGDFVRSDCMVRDRYSGIGRLGSCVTGLKAGDKVYQFDTAGDIVVYEPSNPFRNVGLIVHRAVLKIQFKGETYYLIKGDNNLEPDLFGISRDAAKREEIKGKMILRIPWVGYLKLFLSGQFEEPTNCKYEIRY